MRTWLREYLAFTKKERNGILILVILILLSLLAPLFYPLFIHRSKEDASAFAKELAQLKELQPDSSDEKQFTRYVRYERHPYYETQEKNFPGTHGELFFFDPNTASITDWVRLGVKEKTAATIRKYIDHGGHFYKPEDISKIWGLHADEVARMIPYVRIAAHEEPGKKSFAEQKTRPEPALVDVNVSDTGAFIALPGIGSKLAGRIIAFREKLGGFYSIEQVKETYGLADSVFQKIRDKLRLNGGGVKKININTATLDELKQHPYIRYSLANAFVQYRMQHGNFSSVEDLRKIMILTDEAYNKLAPYLTTGQ